MKSVMQAIWLLVVAFGNLIDIIVIQFQSGLSQVSGFNKKCNNFSQILNYYK